jgi:tyrosinase
VSPTYTRQNVYDLGQAWAPPILWYARGVAAMMARPLAGLTSWRFYGAIHGFDEDLWRQLDQLNASDALPSQTLIKAFWDQCQHGSWYFLPWHRGYLHAFEATIRAAVVALGGPSDWALPYWNHLKSGQAALPPEFASESWPGADRIRSTLSSGTDLRTMETSSYQWIPRPAQRTGSTSVR